MHPTHMGHRARVTLGMLPGICLGVESHTAAPCRAGAGKCPISTGVAGICASPQLSCWGRCPGQHREHPPQDKHRGRGASPAAPLPLWGVAQHRNNYLHFGSHVEFCLSPHGEEGDEDLVLGQDPDPHAVVQRDENGAQGDLGFW